MSNPLIDLETPNGPLRVQMIGDPHLGRVFKTGVPLHRLGEREESQFQIFEELLKVPANVTIIMGDIFDKFNIPNNVLLRTAVLLNNAPNRTLVLKGNHDLSRDSTKKSSFEVLTQLVRSDNVVFADQTLACHVYTAGKKADLLLVPYDAYLTGEQVMQQWLEKNPDQKFLAAFGHWDTEVIAGKTMHNQCPFELLKTVTNLAFSGHEHVPIIKKYENLEFHVTGSMQPYSHAEDPEGKMYVTLSLEELVAAQQTAPEVLKNCCIRVLLKEGEELPEVDCFQLTKKMEGHEELESIDIELIDFSLAELLNEALTEAGVKDEKVLGDILNAYKLKQEGMF